MEVRAITRNIRISPRKARLVCDAVRGKDLRTALAILRFLPQKSAPVIAKTLQSASANAENNYDLDPSTLYVKYVFADDAPQLKRGEFRARGRFNQIIKRSCHITVIVENREQPTQRRPQRRAAAATPAVTETATTTTETANTDQKVTGTDGQES